jgi:hypothetical protein
MRNARLVKWHLAGGLSTLLVIAAVRGFDVTDPELRLAAVVLAIAITGAVASDILLGRDRDDPYPIEHP